jgi:uncharacterized membrane protein YqjE
MLNKYKYKYLNLLFYRFAQILLVESILAFVIGLFYLIIVLPFDDTYLFDMNTFIFSILYILIPFTTGTIIIQIYSSFYKQKNKNNFNDKSFDKKIEK